MTTVKLQIQIKSMWYSITVENKGGSQLSKLPLLVGL